MAIERFSDAVTRNIDQRLRAWLVAQAKSTQGQYESDLKAFAEWAGMDNIGVALQALVQPHPEIKDKAESLKDIGLRVFNVYLEYQSYLATCDVWDRHGRAKGLEPRSGYAPATQQRRLAALRSAVKVTQQAQLCPDIPFPTGPRPEVLRDTSGIGRTAWLQVRDTLDAELDDAKHGTRRHALVVRDTLILRMLHDLGLRRVEVQRLQKEWIRADGEAIGIWRKGGKEQERKFLPIGKGIKVPLAKWLDIRGAHPGPLLTHWTGSTGLTLDGINKICKKWGNLSDIGRMTPHQLRHTAITTLGEKTGGDIVQMQAFARHASPVMTQRYVDNMGEKALHSQELLGDDDE